MSFAEVALMLSALGGFLTGAVAIVVAVYNSRQAKRAVEFDVGRANFDELKELYMTVKAERDDARDRLEKLEKWAERE